MEYVVKSTCSWGPREARELRTGFRKTAELRKLHASAMASIGEQVAPLIDSDDGWLYGEAAKDHAHEHGTPLMTDEDGEAMTEIDEYEIRDRIVEGVLSVEIRSGWTRPGDEMEAAEYCILLGTGGPAARIVGELGSYGEPETARLEVQDWFTPWTAFEDQEDQRALSAYVECFAGYMEVGA